MDTTTVQHARDLDDYLRSVVQSIVQVTEDRIADLRALEVAKSDQAEQERGFWVMAADAGWLKGSNDAERKQAREKAYLEHADEAPYSLITRGKRIAELELEIQVQTLRLAAYRDELNALRTRVALLPVLAQSELGLQEFQQSVATLVAA